MVRNRSTRVGVLTEKIIHCSSYEAFGTHACACALLCVLEQVIVRCMIHNAAMPNNTNMDEIPILYDLYVPWIKNVRIIFFGMNRYRMLSEMIYKIRKNNNIYLQSKARQHTWLIAGQRKRVLCFMANYRDYFLHSDIFKYTIHSFFHSSKYILWY